MAINTNINTSYGINRLKESFSSQHRVKTYAFGVKGIGFTERWCVDLVSEQLILGSIIPNLGITYWWLKSSDRWSLEDRSMHFYIANSSNYLISHYLSRARSELQLTSEAPSYTILEVALAWCTQYTYNRNCELFMLKVIDTVLNSPGYLNLVGSMSDFFFEPRSRMPYAWMLWFFIRISRCRENGGSYFITNFAR